MSYIAFHPLFSLDMEPLHYFSVLGRALYTAQHLEKNCRAIAGLLYVRKQIYVSGSSVLENLVFQKKIGELWRKTLGQHITDLTKVNVLPDNSVPIFKKAVQARNEIAHSLAIDMSEFITSELDERINHIIRLVRSIAEADKIASVMLHLLNKDPLPSKEFFAFYVDRVISWVSEDTFEK